MKKIYLFSAQTLMVLSLVFCFGCSKDDKSGDGNGNETPSGGLYVGQTYQGGVIAYIDDTGKHGLIAAPEDQSPGIRWYNGTQHVETGATGTMVGTGKSNTAKIVQAQGEGNYAAKLCDDLVLNGYSDWYLPSLNELDILYRNKDIIGMFYNSIYWSSSENNTNLAWCQDFTYGSQNPTTKVSAYRVRAVRAF